VLKANLKLMLRAGFKQAVLDAAKRFKRLGNRPNMGK
jgi:hypothetical protein